MPSRTGSADPGRTGRPASDVGSQEGPTGRGHGKGYRAVFRVREFCFVFAAHVLSLLGGVVASVALPVLVYADTSSPLLSALTFALGFLPQALGGALLAPIAERFPARPVLVGCDLICAASVGAMLLPDMPLAGLLALRAVSAFVQPLFGGVRAAGLGEILAGDAFVLGRSLIRISAQAAQIAGFAATGLLLLVLSPESALLLTVGGFLGSAVLLRVGTRRRAPAGRNGHADGSTPPAGRRAAAPARSSPTGGCVDCWPCAGCRPPSSSCRKGSRRPTRPRSAPARWAWDCCSPPCRWELSPPNWRRVRC